MIDNIEILEFELNNNQIDRLVIKLKELKRILQNFSKFSTRTLKERNLAVSATANFANGIIQSSLKESREHLHYQLPNKRINIIGDNIKIKELLIHHEEDELKP